MGISWLINSIPFIISVCRGMKHHFLWNYVLLVCSFVADYLTFSTQKSEYFAEFNEKVKLIELKWHKVYLSFGLLSLCNLWYKFVECTCLPYLCNLEKMIILRKFM